MRATQNTTPTEQHWLAILGRLRVDRKAGLAPHKPLLLLTVAELVEQGLLREPLLRLTGDLTFRFLALWPVVAARRTQPPDIRLPFFHLRGDGVWEPLNDRREATTDRNQVGYAAIEESFFACLADPGFRRRMRQLLIITYFSDPAERAALFDLTGTDDEGATELCESAARFEEARRIGREVRFRLTVVPAYDYTCALTGYRLVTIGAGSIVDAAHIHQFASSRNNDPRNGIALSKNAHWAFDQGLWSLTDDYRVVIARERFQEAGADPLLLVSYAGRKVTLPKDRTLWPDPKHLAWHRRERLLAE